MPWRVQGTAEAGVGWGMPGAAELARAVMCPPVDGAGGGRVRSSGEGWESHRVGPLRELFHVRLMCHRTPGQCVITLRQDFLDVSLPDSEVWLSSFILQLYLHLRRLPRNPSAVVTVGDRDVYMTNMTFAGDQQPQRGVLVKERSNMFISGVCPPYY